jgi:hypothetical protein
MIVLIEIKESTRDLCNSCIRGNKNVKNVRFGTDNFGTVISLCEDCRNSLLEQLANDADVRLVKMVYEKPEILPPDEDDFQYVGNYYDYDEWIEVEIAVCDFCEGDGIAYEWIPPNDRDSYRRTKEVACSRCNGTGRSIIGGNTNE